MKEDIKYAGIDLHQSTCLIEVQDEHGQAIVAISCKNRSGNAAEFFPWNWGNDSRCI